MGSTCPHHVNEVAAGFNGEAHVLLQHPGSPEPALAIRGGALGTMGHIATHIVHIEANEVPEAMRLEHCC